MITNKEKLEHIIHAAKPISLSLRSQFRSELATMTPCNLFRDLNKLNHELHPLHYKEWSFLIKCKWFDIFMIQ
jgi:hypothetical protein